MQLVVTSVMFSSATQVQPPSAETRAEAWSTVMQFNLRGGATTHVSRSIESDARVRFDDVTCASSQALKFDDLNGMLQQ